MVMMMINDDDDDGKRLIQHLIHPHCGLDCCAVDVVLLIAVLTYLADG